MLSRDLDSRLSAREEAATREWLRSGLAVHAMRDHPLHTQPLMGGMWGARLGAGEARAMWGGISHLWQTTWAAMLQDNNTFSHR